MPRPGRWTIAWASDRTLLVAFLVFCITAGGASAQSVGWGASPGRAAYRPESQWNNGPYYTTPHVNPYLPHRDPDTFFFRSDPADPPYSLAPRGRFDAFSPGRGPVFLYAEGFSPYSGYAAWYQKTYGFKPTEQQVKRAIEMYFRSGGPRAAVVDPARVAGVSPSAATPAPRPATTRRLAATTTAPASSGVRSPIPLYRGNLGGD
jgi:hypothetical protein